MFVLTNPHRRGFEQPRVEVPHVKPFALELCQFVLTLLFRLLKILNFRNNRVEYLLSQLMLGIRPRILDILIHLRLHQGHLLVLIKIINQL